MEWYLSVLILFPLPRVIDPTIQFVWLYLELGQALVEQKQAQVDPGIVVWREVRNIAATVDRVLFHRPSRVTIAIAVGRRAPTGPGRSGEKPGRDQAAKPAKKRAANKPAQKSAKKPGDKKRHG